jgi:signal transduction histidine kinase/ActR/RegA family two-component response regulator
MRAALAVTTALFALVLLTWLSLRIVNSDAEGLDQAFTMLNQLDVAESELNRDVLGARAGLVRDYDPLVRGAGVIDRSLAQLRNEATNDAETAAAIDRLAITIGQQEDLIEQFKTNNALLQNSLAYLGLFSSRLNAWNRNEPMAPAVGALTTAMLRFVLDTSPAMAQEVEDRLNALAGQQSSADDSESVQGLLAHGRLLHDLLPATDASLKALYALPLKQNQTEVRRIMEGRRAASTKTARNIQFLLYATSLLLLTALVQLGRRLRARALDLQRRAALEHIIASISTRFINARPLEIGARVEQALGELAEHVKADRAYLVKTSTPKRFCKWSREGATYPPGWPDNAPDLAARLGLADEGIIDVPSNDRLPLDFDREALAAAGLQNWAYVRSLGQDGLVLLGFDATNGRLDTRIEELGLLHMALDALTNAVSRNSLEQERARLEARLQQARRMETVGALTSGIAHNFNNILGAILGHTEMAEDQVASGHRPDKHLQAIHSAGIRARDLVDQILSFGRRRDGHRMPVNVDMLVAETASMLYVSLPARIDLVLRTARHPIMVDGEPAQLQQVILNLCNNAVQAMDEEGRLVVETEVHELSKPAVYSHGELKPGRYVRLAVEDAGRGMDEVTLERIFEPFFTTRPTGNGLGLATVREIVRDHEGAMNVWSKPGVGSRFEVWLPCIVATAPPGLIAIPRALPLGRGETLLLIDDDRARVVKDEEILAALGYEPVGFSRHAEALAASRSTPERFDAVVLNHAGPAGSALDLATALRVTIPDLPIVIATASAEEFDAETLAAAGSFEIVASPLRSAQIAEALKRALAHRSNSAALLQV